MMRMLFAMVLLLVSGVLAAQELSASQRATIRTALLAEPALQQYIAVRNDDPVAAYCNAPVSPAKIGWRTAISFADLFEAMDINIYIARSVAERQAFDLLLNAARDNPGSVSAARLNVRTGVVNIFSGTATTVVAARRAILTAMTEPVTWCQDKLGTTLSATDTINGHVRTWAGTLTSDQISTILNGD